MAENLERPYIGYPSVKKPVIGSRDVNTLPDPKTYAVVSGLFGTAPDQLGFSALKPNLDEIKQAGQTAYYLSLFGQMMPALSLPGMGAKRTIDQVANAEETYRLAQQANTFKAGGRRGYNEGYPQPMGTPSDKLFSNFADNLLKNSPEKIKAFQEAMLDRASSNTYGAPQRSVPTKIAGFDTDVKYAQRDGTTIVTLKDGDKIVGSARLSNGKLDSIAVSPEYSKQGIGKDILRFIDDNKLGNIWEVPDRSPLFVKAQRQLLEEKLQQQSMFEDPFKSSIK
jgi:ribosomal protein S18 acetylase RimI-like enzyme